MKTLEIILREEKELNYDVDGLIVTENNIYFLTEDEEVEMSFKEALPASFEIREKNDLFNKKIYHIKGDIKITLNINDDIFFLDETVLDKTILNHFDGLNLKRVDPAKLTGHKYFQFVDLGTDGNYLYIGSKKSQEMIIMDPYSSRPIQRTDCNMRNSPYFISSSSGLFIGGEDNSKNVYRKFLKEKEVSKIEVKNSKSVDEIVGEGLKFLASTFLSDKYPQFKKNTQHKLGDEIQVVKPRPIYQFSGGGDLYVLMENGEIWVPTERTTVNLGGPWNNEEKEGSATCNHKYAIFFNNNKVGIFQNKKQIGESRLQIDTKNILGIGADKKHVYVLISERIIQRYEIVESTLTRNIR